MVAENIDNQVISQTYDKVVCTTCHKAKPSRHGYYVINASVILTKQATPTGVYTIQAIVDLFHNAMIHCTNCNALYSNIVLHPPLLVLIVSTESFQRQTKYYTVPSTIDSTIVFRDKIYNLFAVTYGNGSHFVNRFFGLGDSKIYEYDGMERRGKLFAITRSLYMHQTTITTTEKVTTYCDNFFYVQNA